MNEYEREALHLRERLARLREVTNQLEEQIAKSKRAERETKRLLRKLRAKGGE